MDDGGEETGGGDDEVAVGNGREVVGVVVMSGLLGEGLLLCCGESSVLGSVGEGGKNLRCSGRFFVVRKFVNIFIVRLVILLVTRML